MTITKQPVSLAQLRRFIIGDTSAASYLVPQPMREQVGAWMDLAPALLRDELAKSIQFDRETGVLRYFDRHLGKEPVYLGAFDKGQRLTMPQELCILGRFPKEIIPAFAGVGHLFGAVQGTLTGYECSMKSWIDVDQGDNGDNGIARFSLSCSDRETGVRLTVLQTTNRSCNNRGEGNFIFSTGEYDLRHDARAWGYYYLQFDLPQVEQAVAPDGADRLVRGMSLFLGKLLEGLNLHLETSSVDSSSHISVQLLTKQIQLVTDFAVLHSVTPALQGL